MADVCDTVTDGCVVYESTNHSWVAYTTELASCQDAIYQLISTSVVDSASLADSAYQVIAKYVAELATLSDVVFAPVDTYDAVIDLALLSDSPLSSILHSVTESAVLADLLAASISANVTERARLVDALQQLASISANTVERALAADAILQSMAAYTVEAASASDAVFAPLSAAALVVESATLVDVISPVVTAVSLVLEAGQLTDATAQHLAAVSLTVETGIALDSVDDGAGSAAWTALAESWGMSRWTELPAREVAEIGGKTVLFGDGIFVMDDQSDDGTLISASVDTGVHDLGSDYLKHLNHAYIHYSTNGVVKLNVGEHSGGKEKFWSYPFERAKLNEVEPGRTKLGRGHKALKYRLVLQNQSGADFDIESLNIMFDNTSRKV